MLFLQGHRNGLLILPRERFSSLSASRRGLKLFFLFLFTNYFADGEAMIIRRFDDLKRTKWGGEPENPEYVIVSKDGAKLDYAWRPAAIERKNGYGQQTR